LGDKLGTTLGQLTDAGVKRVEITYEGEVGQVNTKPITTTILKSLLTPMLDTGVNLVNAPVIAKERGIEIEETVRNHTTKGFTSLISVFVISDNRQRCISGALFVGGQPRIVAMNEVPIEATPEGNLLFVSNNDAPGLIGRVGTILGDAGVNIAGFQLGRISAGGRAIAFINVDQEVSTATLEQLAAVKNVLEVKQIRY
ncbi:MAG: ACT domain-containing protein, partial [Magnetococcales bacterium]|nr:ACT domain-containing protein [Magnetococcales bacterium]